MSGGSEGPTSRLLSRSPEATAALGRRLGRALQAGDVLLLDGPVGGGKTVLAAGVLEGLGAAGPYPSPTFTLVRTYRGRLEAAHLDLYRLQGPLDPAELGLEEVFSPLGVAIVEWAERLGAERPPDGLQVLLARVGAAEERQITILALGPAGRRLLRAATGAAGGTEAGSL